MSKVGLILMERNLFLPYQHIYPNNHLHSEHIYMEHHISFINKMAIILQINKNKKNQ